MFISRLWFEPSLMATILLIFQAFGVEPSSRGLNRTGGRGHSLFGDNPFHEQCETQVSGDRVDCKARAKHNYPNLEDESANCHFWFAVASCLVVPACSKCTNQSISFWIQVEQSNLNLVSAGTCSKWAEDCPQLGCPTKSTTMLTTSRTTNRTTNQSTSHVPTFPNWAIVIVVFLGVIVMLVLVICLYGHCSQANGPNQHGWTWTAEKERQSRQTHLNKWKMRSRDGASSSRGRSQRRAQ